MAGQLGEIRMVAPKAGAAYLGISVPTLYRLLAAKKIPSVKIGRARRIQVAALDAFVESCSSGPGPSN
jgi:excisionase family DNA binding protein